MSERGFVAMMELYIETLTGVLMELMVHPYETVYNVKAKINKLEGFPISEQHLVWQAVELDNAMSLQHYRIPDGATLRLVLNMRGGPINTRRVPLEESSLREMAEYFSDPLGDDQTSGERPVTVIVYQQGEHINFFRLVDRDASSSLSYSLSGGSDYNGEERSPIPKEREDENEKTRNKMKILKEQMENLTISREKKLIKQTRAPRPPSSGRPQSRTKLRHISLATGKETGLLNKNARLPPVGQSRQHQAPLEVSAAKNSLLLLAQSSDSVLSPSGSAAQVPQSESSASCSHQEQKTGEWQVKHFGSSLDSTTHPIPSDTSRPSATGDVLSSAPVPSQKVVNSTIDASVPLPLEQMIIPQTRLSNQVAKQTLSESSVTENDKETMTSLDSKENSKDRPVTRSEKNADSGSVQSATDAQGSMPTPNLPNTTSIPDTEPVPFGNGQWRPNSVKGSNRTVSAQVIPHPPAAPPKYIPFASGTGGHLLQHRHPPDVAKDGSLPAEAVLGYLMSPTRRTGAERKSGGVTLKSLNHKEVRAVSGMLRSIVRSANRSQAGYLVANRKLTQLPTTPTTRTAEVSADDSSTILRVLSGGHEGRATPIRVRLPSVKVTKKKSTKRCGVCRKRTKLATGFQCRCGENFCLIHLCAEAHDCTYDYKAEGRKLIEQSNPVVTAPKLPKI